MGNACCQTDPNLSTSETFKPKPFKVVAGNLDNIHAPNLTRATLEPNSQDAVNIAMEKFRKNNFNLSEIPPLVNSSHLPQLGPYREDRENLYYGQYKEGNKHGTGQYLWPDGNIYYGNFEKDKVHGKGKMLYSDGSSYFGDWEKDKAHGKGFFVDEDGTQYDGDWQEDFRFYFLL